MGNQLFQLIISDTTAPKSLESNILKWAFKLPAEEENLLIEQLADVHGIALVEALESFYAEDTGDDDVVTAVPLQAPEIISPPQTTASAQPSPAERLRLQAKINAAKPETKAQNHSRFPGRDPRAQTRSRQTTTAPAKTNFIKTLFSTLMAKLPLGKKPASQPAPTTVRNISGNSGSGRPKKQLIVGAVVLTVVIILGAVFIPKILGGNSGASAYPAGPTFGMPDNNTNTYDPLAQYEQGQQQKLYNQPSYGAASDLYRPISTNELQTLEEQNMLDFNKGWITPVVQVFYVLAFAVIVLGIMDRRADDEIADAIVAISCGWAVHSGWNIVANTLLPGFFLSNGMTEAAYQDAFIWVIAGIFFGVASLIVIVIALNGERDLTSIGIYLQTIAFLAIFTKNLGALGVMLHLPPESTLLNAKLTMAYLNVGMTEQLGFTWTFLALTVTGAVCYTFETVNISSVIDLFTNRDRVHFEPKWMGLIAGGVLYVAFGVFRFYLTPQLHPSIVTFIALTLATATSAIGSNMQSQSGGLRFKSAPASAGPRSPNRVIQETSYDGVLLAMSVGVILIFFVGLV